MQPLTDVPAEEAAEGSLSPEATAGLWSTLTFRWISPLMSKVRVQDARPLLFKAVAAQQDQEGASRLFAIRAAISLQRTQSLGSEYTWYGSG